MEGEAERRKGLPKVRTKEYSFIAILSFSGGERDYEQVEEEESGGDGRNGRNGAQSLRGASKVRFKK
jgi:hypothetical protein